MRGKKEKGKRKKEKGKERIFPFRKQKMFPMGRRDQDQYENETKREGGKKKSRKKKKKKREPRRREGLTLPSSEQRSPVRCGGPGVAGGAGDAKGGGVRMSCSWK